MQPGRHGEDIGKVYQTPTDTDIHKKDTHGQYQGENDGGRYIFGYDWRLDPVESARELEKLSKK